jgi:hypothetical protein
VPALPPRGIANALGAKLLRGQELSAFERAKLAADAQLQGVLRRARASRVIRERIASWDPEDIAGAAQSVGMHLAKSGSGLEAMRETALYEAKATVAELSGGALSFGKVMLDRALKFVAEAKAGTSSLTDELFYGSKLLTSLERGGGGMSWSGRFTAVSPEAAARTQVKLLGRSSVGTESQIGFGTIAHEHAERVSRRMGAYWREAGHRPGGGSMFGHHGRLPMYAENKAAARISPEFLNETIEYRLRATARQMGNIEKVQSLSLERQRAGVSALNEIQTASRRILRKTDPGRLARLQAEGLLELPKVRARGSILRRMGARPAEIRAQDSGTIDWLEDLVRSTSSRREVGAHQQALQSLAGHRKRIRRIGSSFSRGHRVRQTEASVLRQARRQVQIKSPAGRRQRIQGLLEMHEMTYAPRVRFAPGLPEYGSGHGGLVRELDKRALRSKVVDQRSRSSLPNTPPPPISPPMHRNQGSRLSRGGGGIA